MINDKKLCNIKSSRLKIVILQKNLIINVFKTKQIECWKIHSISPDTQNAALHSKHFVSQQWDSSILKKTCKENKIVSRVVPATVNNNKQKIKMFFN